MDPITFVVTAVVAGAAAGLTDTASQVIKDAYAGLKALLSRRDVDVSAVERKPDSETKKASLREDLADLEGTSHAVDAELEDAARRVLAAVEEHDPDAARAVGIDLKKLDVGGSLTIERVTAGGTGVSGEDWKIAGDASLRDIHGGRPAPSGGGGNRPS